MLLVQKFLENHTFQELIDLHGVYASFSNCGSFWSLSYDQIESKESDLLAQQCRGLILAKLDETSLLSQAEMVNNRLSYNHICPGQTFRLACPFFRFFNSGMGAAAEIDWNDPSLKIYNKEDGCLDENTQISTVEGLKTIKYLCENKKNIQVFSLNTETGDIEIDDIVGFSIKNNNDDWYEITLYDDTKIILTGSHRVFIPKINCYRQVKDLCGDEYFLLKK